MTDDLLRAQFNFGADSEVRYIASTPAVGAYVTHGRQLWRVSTAEIDRLGLNVVCQRAISPEQEPAEE